MIAAQRGFIDAIVDPSDTRELIAKGLDMLANKEDIRPWKKHANMPL